MAGKAERKTPGRGVGELRSRESQGGKLKEVTVPIVLETLDQSSEEIGPKEQVGVGSEKCLTRRRSDSYRDCGLKLLCRVVCFVGCRRQRSVLLHLKCCVIGKNRSGAAEIAALVHHEKSIADSARG